MEQLQWPKWAVLLLGRSWELEISAQIHSAPVDMGTMLSVRSSPVAMGLGLPGSSQVGKHMHYSGSTEQAEVLAALDLNIETNCHTPCSAALA